jgi:AraC-like DNA-binding protein
MIRYEVINLALEVAITTQLGVLTLSLLSRPRRSVPALWILAGITGSTGFMMGTNGLMQSGAWMCLSDVNLFVELLLPPAIYLYVAQFRRPPPPLYWVDSVHASPAIIGILVWEAGLARSMDLYVIGCWLGYIAGAFAFVLHNAEDFASASLRRFLAIFLFLAFLVVAFRVTVVLDLPQAGSFRESIPFLLLLAALLLTTCLVLHAALKHPELLSTFGGPIKYAHSGANQGDLAALGNRLDKLLNSERPYLDPDLSLSQLAAQLDASHRHVSQLINTRFGMNFPAYMNYCRVQLASQKLDAERFALTAIKSIMYESGFKSKSVFNREFHRHFGVSPSAYKRRGPVSDIAIETPVPFAKAPENRALTR